jgi:hypothetical protein
MGGKGHREYRGLQKQVRLIPSGRDQVKRGMSFNSFSALNSLL